MSKANDIEMKIYVFFLYLNIFNISEAIWEIIFLYKFFLSYEINIDNTDILSRIVCIFSTLNKNRISG